MIDGLLSVADDVDGVVFDQWGVLHDGSTPYPGAVEAIEHLHAAGKQLAVLSNSGKRAAPNRQRIAAMGLPAHLFSHVMTSGEAFFSDIERGSICPGRMLPITAKPDDFEAWLSGLTLETAQSLDEARSVLLMGVPEGSDGSAEQALLDAALLRKLPVYCTNPDRASPRAGGVQQLGPGALAHAYLQAGGDVTFYGKPHQPVFDVLQQALGIAGQRLLMVGDSLEHDIAGGRAAGWQTAFVTGGLHADSFINTPALDATRALAQAHKTPMPNFIVGQLAPNTNAKA